MGIGTNALRKATQEDWEVIVDMNIALAKETEGADLDRETVNKGVAAVFKDPSKGTYYLAAGGRRAVAQLLVTFEWSDWRNAPIWWVQSVYVKPDHRRMGHFKRLYEHVREAARQSGAAGIRLYAERSNADALAVYKGAGFKEHYIQLEDMFTSST